MYNMHGAHFFRPGGACPAPEGDREAGGAARRPARIGARSRDHRAATYVTRVAARTFGSSQSGLALRGIMLLASLREVAMLLALLLASASAASAETIQKIAFTDAKCTQHPRVLASHTLGACQQAYATSEQLSFVCMTPDCPDGLGCSGGCPNDTLVITGVLNHTSCDGGCEGGCSQYSNGKPFQCDEFQADGVTLYSRWVKVDGPCQPGCALCRGLYLLAQCDYVPSTVPPTPFGEALPGCVGCAAALRDNEGCSCASCFEAAPQVPTCAPGEYCPPPPTPQGPPGCIGGMCAGVLGVPCMDCGAASGGNKTACRLCMKERINAPELGGACDFMSETLCNPDNC